MPAPYLEVDLGKIRHNASVMKARCAARGVEITFVTKGVCADPSIIAAVRSCGINRFADSRMMNIIAAKKALADLWFLLIRVPMLSEIEAVVTYADCSLQSQIETIRAVSDEALRQHKVHPIILMVDVGDLREGVFGAEAILEIVPQILSCPGVKLTGLGTNVGCYGSILPSEENCALMVHHRDLINERFGLALDAISGGATCTTMLMDNGILPAGINGLRIGEAILYGEDTTGHRQLDGLYNDAFTLGAEVVELRRKPTMPIGERGRDCFGNVSEYEDRGIRLRAICAVGKQDVYYNALTPLLAGAEIVGASSDHLIVDVEGCGDAVQVGTVLRFRCGYMTGLMATTSGYVSRIMI